MRVKTLCSVMVAMLTWWGARAAMADDPAGATPPPAAAPTETPVAAATAATGTEAKMQLGADGAFLLPLGNFSNGVSAGFGALLRYEYNLIPQLNLTGRLGFLYYLAKDIVPGGSYSFWNIPLLVGAKYDIAQGFYGAAELGLFFNHSSATISILGVSGSSSNTETDFGGTVGVGYRKGDLEGRVGLTWANLAHAGDSMGLMANVGYSFMKM